MFNQKAQSYTLTENWRFKNFRFTLLLFLTRSHVLIYGFLLGYSQVLLLMHSDSWV